MLRLILATSGTPFELTFVVLVLCLLQDDPPHRIEGADVNDRKKLLELMCVQQQSDWNPSMLMEMSVRPCMVATVTMDCCWSGGAVVFEV